MSVRCDRKQPFGWKRCTRFGHHTGGQFVEHSGPCAIDPKWWYSLVLKLNGQA